MFKKLIVMLLVAVTMPLYGQTQTASAGAQSTPCTLHNGVTAPWGCGAKYNVGGGCGHALVAQDTLIDGSSVRIHVKDHRGWVNTGNRTSSLGGTKTFCTNSWPFNITGYRIYRYANGTLNYRTIYTGPAI